MKMKVYEGELAFVELEKPEEVQCIELIKTAIEDQLRGLTDNEETIDIGLDAVFEVLDFYGNGIIEKVNEEWYKKGR